MECLSFKGCRTEAGDCGYLIRIRDEVRGGEEVISNTFDLGCVPPGILASRDAGGG